MDAFTPSTWSLAHNAHLTLGPKAEIMGILNVTPDSFSDGGQFDTVNEAVRQSKLMTDQGVSIVDVGGESTRPGARSINGDEELIRVIPVIEALSKQSGTILSIDTYRSETAAAAVSSGAHIVNDVWGCQREPDIANVAADTGAGLVIMNTRRDREVLPDLLEDAKTYLSKSLEIAHKAGVKDSQIVLDPGFGFARTTDHDIPILARLEELLTLGYPLLIGTSRKRFLGDITSRAPDLRGPATAATSVIARLKGGAVFRVHDVEFNLDALAVTDAHIESSLKT